MRPLVSRHPVAAFLVLVYGTITVLAFVPALLPGGATLHPYTENLLGVAGGMGTATAPSHRARSRLCLGADANGARRAADPSQAMSILRSTIAHRLLVPLTLDRALAKVRFRCPGWSLGLRLSTCVV
jgi:hypothetical protein